MKLEIEVELVQQLINYLAQRPFAEVHQLITRLSQLNAQAQQADNQENPSVEE